MALDLKTVCRPTQKSQGITSISYIVHYSNIYLMNIAIQVTNNEHIITHYFHYEGILIHNSVFIIISKTMHLTDALYQNRSRSSVHAILTQIIPKNRLITPLI